MITLDKHKNDTFVRVINNTPERSVVKLGTWIPADNCTEVRGHAGDYGI